VTLAGFKTPTPMERLFSKGPATTRAPRSSPAPAAPIPKSRSGWESTTRCPRLPC
jgi:hypothetical protein